MKEILDKAPPPFQGTEIYTLPNGLTLILKEDHTVPVVSLQAWARCGAINENPTIYGISHGLEHMVFKGTPTRSAGEITKTIESHGGTINAATQLETTHYYIDIPSYGTKTALEVLADTILNPTFPEEELQRERLVILEEIHRRDDDPEATLWDEFASHVFQNTPYATKVIGNIKTVSSMSRNDLSSYFKSHYVPKNKSIVVAGDFKKGELFERLQNLFGTEEPKEPPPTPTVNPGDVKGEITLRKPVQLCYFALGLPTVGLGHEDSIGLDLLADVLGGGTSSRFYQTFREEKKLVLSLSCDYISFQQKGLFSFFGEALPQNADEAIRHILNEIQKIQNSPLLQAELDRAKARIKSDWLFGSETSRGQADTLGSLSVHNHIDLLSTYLSKIEKFDLETLMSIFIKHLKEKKIFVAKIIPSS